MPRVLLTDPIDASGVELLRARGAEVVLAPEGSSAWCVIWALHRP